MKTDNNILKNFDIKNLDFLLTHLSEPLFPRSIFTHQKQYQFSIRSKQEMFNYFEGANYIDCKINAFPSLKKGAQWAPDFIFIDLDLKDFKSKRSLDYALNKTVTNIEKRLEGYPTVLWSGGGYHVYQPIEGIILEDYREFNEFRHIDLFKKFLRFSKDFLSNGKADKNNHPSLESCLLRVPGSVNSKYSTEVKIIQKWDGKRSHIRLLLGDFLAYLVDLQFNEKKFPRNTNYNWIESNSITWIEKLLQTPIEDGRKYCLWRILCPYLVHRIPFDGAFKMLKEWLNECDKKRRLDFNPDSQINTNLRNAHEWFPIGLEKLKEEKNGLYQIIIQHIG